VRTLTTHRLLVPIASPYHPTVVPEAELEQTDAGLVPAGVGWFVMNARDARWFHRPGRDSLPLTGSDEFEAETRTATSAYAGVPPSHPALHREGLPPD
jgi:hypothetical protein